MRNKIIFSMLLFATLFVFFVGTNAWSLEQLGGMPKQPKGGFKNEKEYVKWLKKSKKWYKDYSNILRNLSASLSRKVDDPNLYMVNLPHRGLMGELAAVDKSTAINVTYIGYLAYTRKHNKPFLQKELTSNIRSMLEESEKYKKNVRDYINKLEKEADYANSQKAAFENALHGRPDIETISPQAEKKSMHRGTLKVPGWQWSLDEGEGYIYKVICAEYSTVTGRPKAPPVTRTFHGAEQFRKQLKDDYCAPSIRYKTYTKLRIEVTRKSTGKTKVYEGERGKPKNF